MPQAFALRECRVGTFLPYQPDSACATLSSLPATRSGASMFIFQRPLLGPLLALAMAAMLVVLSALVDLSAVF
jgi:hypothetical protein